MAVSVQKFLDKVEEIKNEGPSYEIGHDGSDGKCDCIGLVKGALRRSGATPDGLKGTNWAQRHTIKNQYPIGDGSRCKVGDVVLKYHAPGESGWDLPSSYSSDPDQNDYYHIGVVTSVNPLRITHMTTPSVKVDTKVGQWRIGGELPQVDYGSSPAPSPDPDPEPEPEPMPVDIYATVYAPTGKTVNIRKRASVDSPLVERVPIGDSVLVMERGSEWCKVAYTDPRRATWRGYMMTEFLIFSGSPDSGSDEDLDGPTYDGCTVTISGLTKEEADTLKAQYPQAVITVG